MGRTRTFIGVEVGNDVRQNAVTLQQSLARSGAAVSWASATNLHVTLLFLGEVDDRELHAVSRAMADAVAGEPPFALRVQGVGAFPNLRRPKTVWAGIADGAAELVRLHGLLEPPLLALGAYRREDRTYSPHLTLGRVKSEADGQALAPVLPKYADWTGGRTTVSELVLFASDLRRDGPVYTVLARGPLSGGA
ncbi:MAG TPA: RNA 2',3'-cyclic phosphodiesterase [Fimbriiglobus sp.]|nr:RNA 2',3'-cyclic phosphodiesterase [Fimbriiglobus sp.]